MYDLFLLDGQACKFLERYVLARIDSRYAGISQHGCRPVPPFRPRLELGQEQRVHMGVGDLEIVVDLRETLAHRLDKSDEFGYHVGLGGVEIEKLADLMHHADVPLRDIHLDLLGYKVLGSCWSMQMD